ncbi:ABC transporter permease subunit [Candidatus Mycoplasma pogonae]
MKNNFWITEKKFSFLYWKIWVKKIWFLVLFILFIWAIYSIFSSINYLGVELFQENLTKLFSFENNVLYPSYNLWSLSLQMILKTLQYVFLGTTSGFVLAVFTAFLAARNFWKTKWKYLIKIIILALRAFPALVFLMAFQMMFSKDLAAVFILFWFSWLWLHKYIINIYENIVTKNYWFLYYKTNSKLLAFYKEIFPRVLNRLIALFFYSIEANLLWTTILSGVGLTGIGNLISQTYQEPNVGFEALGIPLFSLIFTIIFFEIIILLLNRFVLKVKTRHNLKIAILPYKKMTKIVLLIIILILFISLATMIEYKTYFDQNTWSYFKNIFAPNLQLFSNWDWDNNPFLIFFLLIKQTYVIVYITFFASIIIGYFLNQKLQKFYVYLFFKVLNAFWRVIPVIFWIFLLSPLFSYPSYFITSLIIALNTSFYIGRKTSNIIDEINFRTYKNLKLKKWSNIKILLFFIWPSIKKDFYSLLFFELENILRSLVFLGFFGVSLYGEKMYSYIELGPMRNLNNFFAYVWVLWTFLFVIEIISWKEAWVYIFRKTITSKIKQIN